MVEQLPGTLAWADGVGGADRRVRVAAQRTLAARDRVPGPLRQRRQPLDATDEILVRGGLHARSIGRLAACVAIQGDGRRR